MEEIFRKRMEQQEEIVAEQTKKFNALGFYKFGLFLFSAVAFYYYGTRDSSSLYLVLGGVSFFLFVLLYLHHNVVEEALLHAKGMVEINQRQLDRISGKWTSFPDLGEDFSVESHPYGSDLDIVGTRSLFQFLNSSHSYHGRQCFGQDLLSADYSPSELEARQEAVKELKENLDFCQEFEYQMTGVALEDGNLAEKCKDDKAFLSQKALKQVLFYAPFGTAPFAIGVFALSLNHLVPLASVILGIQAVIWLIGSGACRKYVAEMGQLPHEMKEYRKAIQMISGADFSTAKLQEIQQRLNDSSQSAEKAMEELEKIGQRLSLKTNPILGFGLNVFFLWNYRCAFALEEWKRHYGAVAEDWFWAMGELESLYSFSQLAWVCPVTSLPDVSTKEGEIQGKALGHPLLHNDSRVCNDISFSKDIFIISGSNMSGKTTFMRTIGINMVLAQGGGFVCGASLCFSPMKIITSMRIADNLGEGISTFYAEIKGIKGILDQAKEKRDSLFLIDEIFRGTNSMDRIGGAEAVLAKLNQWNVAGMITTHDLELCAMAESQGRIQNFHFSEHYENNQIKFDYRMKSGQSTSTNGRFLMEMVGIL